MDNPFEQKEKVAEIANLITARGELRNILAGITQAIDVTMNRGFDASSDEIVEMKQRYCYYQKMLWAANSQLDSMWSLHFDCDAWFKGA